MILARAIFLSKRVAERFTGYAVDQLGRMERSDAEWLLSVRHGALTCEQVLALATERKARLDGLIATSPLPEAPEARAVDALLVSLQEEFLMRQINH